MFLRRECLQKATTYFFMAGSLHGPILSRDRAMTKAHPMPPWGPTQYLLDQAGGVRLFNASISEERPLTAS